MESDGNALKNLLGISKCCRRYQGKATMSQKAAGACDEGSDVLPGGLDLSQLDYVLQTIPGVEDISFIAGRRPHPAMGLR